MLGTSASSSISLSTAMRNNGSVAHRSCRRSHHGRASRDDSGHGRSQRGGAGPSGGRVRSFRGLARQSSERLTRRHPIPLADQDLGDLHSRRIEGHDRFLARHQEAGDANGRGETRFRGASYNHGHLRSGAELVSARPGDIATQLAAATRAAPAAVIITGTKAFITDTRDSRFTPLHRGQDDGRQRRCRPSYGSSRTTRNPLATYRTSRSYLKRAIERRYLA